jgi:hypothetical protein
MRNSTSNFHVISVSLYQSFALLNPTYERQLLASSSVPNKEINCTEDRNKNAMSPITTLVIGTWSHICPTSKRSGSIPFLQRTCARIENQSFSSSSTLRVNQLAGAGRRRADVDRALIRQVIDSLKGVGLPMELVLGNSHVFIDITPRERG